MYVIILADLRQILIMYRFSSGVLPFTNRRIRWKSTLANGLLDTLIPRNKVLYVRAAAAWKLFILIERICISLTRTICISSAVLFNMKSILSTNNHINIYTYTFKENTMYSCIVRWNIYSRFLLFTTFTFWEYLVRLKVFKEIWTNASMVLICGTVDQ